MADDLGDLRKLTIDLTTAGPRVGALASQILRKAALDVEAEAKRLAPVDTGNLRASIGVDLGDDGRSGTASATIGPTASYGIYLEHGTRRMAPRPYMGPALDKVAPGFEAAIGQAAGSVLDG